jgi:site-specific DNA recombinase
MNKAIGYIRVSTGRQEAEGISLQAQQAKVTAMASLKDLDLVEVVTDDTSGKSLNRQGLQHVLRLVESGAIQAIIVTKLDRLTRRLTDLLSLLDLFKRHGVTLISINESLDTETPIGRLMVNLIGSINEFERENISARVTESLSFKASKGGCVGQVPYGYVKHGKAKDSVLVPDATEQSVIARMKALRASKTSLRGICEVLTAEGVQTRKGTAWKPQYVDSVLRSSIMAPTSDMINDVEPAQTDAVAA